MDKLKIFWSGLWMLLQWGFSLGCCLVSMILREKCFVNSSLSLMLVLTWGYRAVLERVAGSILLFLGLARLSVSCFWLLVCVCWYEVDLWISFIYDFTQALSKEFISHRPPVLPNKARRAHEYSLVTRVYTSLHLECMCAWLSFRTIIIIYYVSYTCKYMYSPLSYTCTVHVSYAYINE